MTEKKAEVPVWTWRDAIRKSMAPAMTKHICNCIANYVSDVGAGAFPSVKTLMQDSGLSNKSVATHLDNAERCGLLFIDRSGAGKDGRYRRSKYYPRFPDEAVLKRQADRISTAENEEPDPEDDPSDADDQVKEIHSAKPSEGDTPGDHVNLAPKPSELGAENRVKEVHANSPIELSKELPKLFASLPEKDARPDCIFENGQIALRNGLRSFWLDKFEGDAERLELGLITAAGYVQPNSNKPIEAQVGAQLARQLSEKRDRDKRYAAAAVSSKGGGKPRSDSRTQAYLAKLRAEREAVEANQ